MGCILEFTKVVTPEDCFKFNPLDLPNSLVEYRYKFELPLKDGTEELLLLLCHRFRTMHGREPS
jgi:hypothetical protein